MPGASGGDPRLCIDGIRACAAWVRVARSIRLAATVRAARLTRGAATAGLNDSALVRLLSALAVPDVSFSSDSLSERLGGLVDFKDSMRLAAFHDELRRAAFEPAAEQVGAETLQAEFAQLRLSLARAVLESFLPDAGAARPKFPPLAADMALERLLAYEPYHRFYAAHQRSFEGRLQSLQLRVRGVLAGRSAELARLAAMDQMLRDTVLAHTRKSLAAIPQLLGRRFDSLVQAYRARQGMSADSAADLLPQQDLLAAWTRPGEWLDTFAKDMQSVLLAELDLRLMPILGLVEAIDEEVMRK